MVLKPCGSLFVLQILAPVEDAVKRYADLEQQYLSAELQQLAAKGEL